MCAVIGINSSRLGQAVVTSALARQGITAKRITQSKARPQQASGADDTKDKGAADVHPQDYGAPIGG